MNGKFLELSSSTIYKISMEELWLFSNFTFSKNGVGDRDELSKKLRIFVATWTFIRHTNKA